MGLQIRLLLLWRSAYSYFLLHSLSVLVCPLIYMTVTQAAFTYHVAFNPRPTIRDVRKDMGTSCFNWLSLFIMLLNFHPGASYLQSTYVDIHSGVCVRPKYRRSRWFPFSLWALIFTKVVCSLNAHLEPAGLSASAQTACGGSSIGDLFAPHERAFAMSLYALGSLVGTNAWLILLHKPLILFSGPAVGPIAGGYIVQTVGVKWVFIAIASLYLFPSLWLEF